MGDTTSLSLENRFMHIFGSPETAVFPGFFVIILN